MDAWSKHITSSFLISGFPPATLTRPVQGPQPRDSWSSPWVIRMSHTDFSPPLLFPTVRKMFAKMMVVLHMKELPNCTRPGPDHWTLPSSQGTAPTTRAREVSEPRWLMVTGKSRLRTVKRFIELLLRVRVGSRAGDRQSLPLHSKLERPTVSKSTNAESQSWLKGSVGSKQVKFED